jgi:hypothetical protein
MLLGTNLFFLVKDWQMVTLFQIFGEICFYFLKEFTKLRPLKSGVGISLSINCNLNDLVQIRFFYGKLLSYNLSLETYMP